MQTKLEIKAARLLSIDRRRKAHNAALSSLHASPLSSAEHVRANALDAAGEYADAAQVRAWAENDLAPQHEARGLKMWRKLRDIEAKAHACAVAIGNGSPGYSETKASHAAPGLSELEYFEDCIRAEVSRVFGGVLPRGFTFNTDWREPALQLAAGNVPDGMPVNRAGNGIVAAKISA